MNKTLTCPSCEESKISLIDKLFQFSFPCKSCGAILRLNFKWLALSIILSAPLFYFVFAAELFPIGFIIPIIVVFGVLVLSPLVVIREPNS